MPRPANARAAQARVARGIAAQQAGRLAEALRAHDQAIALDGGAVEAHANRAKVLALLGRAAEAVASFDSALALAPGMRRCITAAASRWRC